MFEWWSIPRRAWMIILAELGAIVGLSGWVVSEYLNNVYFQSYLNGLLPVLVPVVSVTFGVASSSAAVVLYFGTRKIRRLDSSDFEEARKAPTRKMAKRTKLAESKTAKTGPLSSISPAKPTQANGGKTVSTREEAIISALKKKEPT